MRSVTRLTSLAGTLATFVFLCAFSASSALAQEAVEQIQAKAPSFAPGGWSGNGSEVVGAPDGSCANMGAVGKQNTTYGYGFQLPNDAVIQRIDASIYATTGSAGGQNIGVQLADDATTDPASVIGGPGTLLVPDNGANCAGAAASTPFGGSDYTDWGFTTGWPTVSTINSPNFGVIFTKLETSSIKVDAVCLKITYLSADTPVISEECFVYPATLTIVKNVTGADGVFAIDLDGPDSSLPTTYNLDTSAGPGTASDTFQTTTFGDYSLQENVTSGYQLVSASCVDDDTAAPVGTFDSVDTISGITLDNGQNVTCTFQNAQLGTVTVVKNTVGADGSFDFTTDVPTLGTAGAFNLVTSGGTAMISSTANGVPAGTYSIAETDPTPAFDLTSATCDNADDPSALTLAAGDSVTCTFTNTARGSITVVKTTEGGDGSFDFTTSTLPGGNFTIDTSGNTGQQVFSNLVSGTYDVAETVPSGWDLDSATCDDASDPASIGLSPGENVTCTFNDIEHGSVTVVKHITATGPASQAFGFTSDLPSYGTFTLTPTDSSTDDSTGPIEVSPGTFSVAEDDPTADGWELVSSSCSDGSQIDAIGVSAGEDVTCTFTNAPLGSATVVKNSVGGTGVFGFSWDNNVPVGESSSFNLDTSGGGNTDSMDFTYELLTSTDYDLSESSVPTPVAPYNRTWQLTDVSCPNQPSANPGSDATMNVQSGDTATCSFTNTLDGAIVVQKVTVPSGLSDTFTFTGDVPGDIADGGELSQSLQPGSYSVAESAADGFTLTDISCSGDTNSQINYNASSVDIDLAAGEVITCVFTNTQGGSITIEKETVGDTGAFTFNTTNLGGSFQLDTNDANPDSQLFDGLLPDTYTVSEVLPPSGWDLTDISCSGATDSTVTIGGTGGFTPGDVGVSVDLSAGENIVCRYTNTARGSITVVKTTDGGDGSFDFTTSTLPGGNFSIDTSGNTGQQAFTNLVNGTYDVSETVPTGWDLDTATCDDASDPSAIDLAPGEDVTCTFANVQQGSITVVKNTVGGDDTFGFTSTALGGFSIATSGNTGSQDFDNLSASSYQSTGTYDVAETVPTGWDLDTATCDDASDPSAITLDPGEHVTCTFTDVQQGSITVVKNTVGGDGEFGFTSTALGGFSIATSGNTGSQDFTNLSASSYQETGSYDVAETVPTGWDLDTATCDDASDPAAIDLSPGEHVTCTFTNVQQGNITIVKNAMGGDDTFGFLSNALGGFDIATSGGAGQQDFTNLPASSYQSTGTYDVAEDTPPEGWTQGDATCDDGSDPSAIDLDPGETVTCTFTNSAPGEITVVKDATLLVDGEYCFDASGPDLNDSFCIETTDGTGSESSGPVLPVGHYSITENITGQFAVSSMECDNGDTADSIDLGAGDTVTCTFVNIPVTPVPVNNPWALLLMILALLATGWYFRPSWARRF